MPDFMNWSDEAIAALIAAALAIPVALSIAVAIFRARIAARRGRRHPQGGSDHLDFPQDQQSIASSAFRTGPTHVAAASSSAVVYTAEMPSSSDTQVADSPPSSESVDSGSSRSDQ
jgi:hypothetical protein